MSYFSELCHKRISHAKANLVIHHIIFFVILLIACTSTSTEVSQFTDDTVSLHQNVRIMGEKKAPVSLTVYCDYACPICTSFQEQQMPKIKSDYIDTGKVFLEFRDYPKIFKHPGAMLAAQYANCAAEQGFFWKMHDRLYSGTANSEWYWGDEKDLATLSTYAKEIGIDSNQLESCIATQKTLPQIESDIRTLHTALPDGAHTNWPNTFVPGEQGTPTFFINGVPVVGGYATYEDWKIVLDKAIAANK